MVFSLCFEFGHVVLDLFSLLPTRKYAWQQLKPTLIVDLSTQEPCRFSLAKQVSFEHSLSSPGLLLLREGKKNIQTNDRLMTRQFLRSSSSIGPQLAQIAIATSAAAPRLPEQQQVLEPSSYPARCRRLLAMLGHSLLPLL